MASQISRDKEFSGRTVCLASSARMAEALAAHVNDGGALTFARGDLHGVSFARDPEVERRARTFLQNVGGILSSRQAEDALAASGVIARTADETLFARRRRGGDPPRAQPRVRNWGQTPIPGGRAGIGV